MSTITATYCAFCYHMNKVFARMLKSIENYSIAIAASRMAQMGYQEQAKNLMEQLKKET